MSKLMIFTSKLMPPDIALMKFMRGLMIFMSRLMRIMRTLMKPMSCLMEMMRALVLRTNSLMNFMRTLMKFTSVCTAMGSARDDVTVPGPCSGGQQRGARRHERVPDGCAGASVAGARQPAGLKSSTCRRYGGLSRGRRGEIAGKGVRWELECDRSKARRFREEAVAQGFPFMAQLLVSR